jgi:2-oxoglutarate ferredoxin oxidoreductase subunit alpha
VITSTRVDVSDLTVMVSGQGGDGSLTIVTLLGKLLASRGFHLYQSRDVRSRIKGGTAAAIMRASATSRGCIADTVDLAIVFDDEALAGAAPRVGPGSVVVVDSSLGSPPAGAVPEGVELIEVPFGRLAVRELRRDLFKNSLAFGIATRLLSIPDAEAEEVLRDRFRRLPEAAIEANIGAARRGFEFAAAQAATADNGAWRLADPPKAERLLMMGNEAVALGFVVAGGRFFAGYPITPATEILEWLQRHLPAVGGHVVQAEDELAAINMALGAALTGARAMTSTSGPGIALMQEAVGHAGSAEIPVVVVDCQRAGPSTGMPTKPEQSDLQMLALGANGDFPRIVLAPTGPADAFDLSIAAVNLSQRLQCPVYLALDQAVAQNAATVDPFDVENVVIESPKQLDGGQTGGNGVYRRYELTADGISPWVLPGDPAGFSLVTGNEHDPWGYVSIDPENRVAMVDKRARKLDLVIPELPRGDHFGDPTQPIGVLGVGMEAGVMREAVELMELEGLPVAGLAPRTIWPIADDTRSFLAVRDHTYVIEHNAGGQLAGLLRHGGVPDGALRSVLRYDGVPFSPHELAETLLRLEAS